VPKSEIIKYAKKHRLEWIEDSTNENTKYLRNYIRKNITPGLSGEKRKHIVENADKVAKNSGELNELIATLSQNVAPKGIINRSKFTCLPVEVESELAMYWLRSLELEQYDRKMIERLVLTLKTGLPGTKHSVHKSIWLELKNKTAKFAVSS
jgi:tRNA(Ile)-lysidine synthase